MEYDHRFLFSLLEQLIYNHLLTFDKFKERLNKLALIHKEICNNPKNKYDFNSNFHHKYFYELLPIKYLIEKLENEAISVLIPDEKGCNARLDGIIFSNDQVQLIECTSVYDGSLVDLQQEHLKEFGYCPLNTQISTNKKTKASGTRKIEECKIEVDNIQELASKLQDSICNAIKNKINNNSLLYKSAFLTVSYCDIFELTPKQIEDLRKKIKSIEGIQFQKIFLIDVNTRNNIHAVNEVYACEAI